MKYEIGKIRAIAIIEERVNSLKFLDMHAPVKNILNKSTMPNLLGKLLAKLIPRLFKNILSLLYFGLFHLVSKYGTKVSDKIKAIKLAIPEKSTTCSLNKTLTYIPNQKIRFQKLSLFSRNLIQFMMILNFFKVLKVMVSRFDIFVKQIIKSLIIILISSLQIIAFAQDVERDLTSLISSVEKEYNIPSGLLKAITEVESNLNAYAINVSGKSFVAKSSLEASTIIRSYLKKGYTNIDVGLAQINWYWHGRNFRSIEEMLIPKNNIQYAAKTLTKLYRRHGDWQKVVRLYHSAKPQHHKKYSRKVLLSWLDG